jgi:hypothetical protein
MPMMETSELLTYLSRFVATLTNPKMSGEDATRLGTALLVGAETVFKGVGGPGFAAAQFYVAADRCAAQSARST